jgi:4-alpha-glucanotransferase
LLISLDALVVDGWLLATDLVDVPRFPTERVDYGPVIEYKFGKLKHAYENFIAHADETARADYLDFVQRSAGWLEDYALYRALKDEHGGAEWTKWEPYLRDRENNALHFFKENHALAVGAHRFYQYLFFKQWARLAAYANGQGVKLIGDIPIFVAHDSADVWAHRDLFYLDEAGNPTKVAGVPPDYFSETGQLWGNPLYRWDLMERNGFTWWIDRIRATLAMVDLVRLDHFRGFESYWAVPASEATAVNGTWEPGPGAALFTAIKKTLGDLPIIAEDLGLITPAVKQLRDAFAFPGMCILQFAFGADPQADEFKPYNFKPNAVVYTGTHDNDTAVGWFTAGVGDSTRTADEVAAERQFVLDYLGSDGSEIHWDLVRVALASVANMAMIPLQDILGCGSEARMNVPARESGNWGWRFQSEQLTSEIQARLAKLTNVYGRDRHLRTEELRDETEPTADREARKPDPTL